MEGHGRIFVENCSARHLGKHKGGRTPNDKRGTLSNAVFPLSLHSSVITTNQLKQFPTRSSDAFLSFSGLESPKVRRSSTTVLELLADAHGFSPSASIP